MKIINREPGGGKTRALLEMVIGDASIIYVAPTRAQAEHAYREARSMTPMISRGRFISIHQVPTYRGVNPAYQFVLDEVEGILGGLIGGTVIAIAGSDEDLKRGRMVRSSGGNKK